MRARRAKKNVLSGIGVAACALLCAAAGGVVDPARDFVQGFVHRFVAARTSDQAQAGPPLLLAQNSSTPLTLPELAEPPVSPINPGTLPGSTAAIGGNATGTNPVTGLPCNGLGALAVSGAGGLPGTATPPQGLSTETLDQIPVGAPPVTSIYGSQSSLGPC